MKLEKQSWALPAMFCYSFLVLRNSFHYSKRERRESAHQNMVVLK